MKDGRILQLLLLMPAEFPFIRPVAAQLRKDLETIGIKLLVRSEPFARLADTRQSNELEYDMLWTGGHFFYDPDLAASRWYSGHPANKANYSSPELDELVLRGRRVFDPVERIRVYRQIDKLLREDVPTAFLCRTPFVYVHRSELGGTETMTKIGPFKSIPLWYWRVGNN